MSDVRDWLRVLDLAPGASFEDVRRAHRDMAKVWHPDRFPNDRRLREKAEQHQKAINEAFANIENWVKSGRPLPLDDAGVPAPHPEVPVTMRGGAPPVHKRHPLRDTWTIRPPLGFNQGIKRTERSRAPIWPWIVAAAVVLGVVVALSVLFVF